MIPVSNSSTTLAANLSLYRRKVDPIIVKVDDSLQYDVPADEIDKGEEVVNKRYADENLVQKVSVVTSTSSTSDDDTIPTTKAVDSRIKSATTTLTGKVDTTDGSATRLTLSSGGVNTTNALSIKDYGSSKGWGIQTTPANETACQIWRFNDSLGAYRASMSQAGKNVTIDDFLRISLSGFGSGIDCALSTKPANANDCGVWTLKNSTGTSIASIWQADNVARLVGFSSNLLKFINYGGGLSEAITFTPTALSSGVATLRFNDTTGAVKSTISQRTDGAIRITGSNGMDMIGYTGNASGLSCTPGDTGITYPIKFQSTTAAIQGFVYQAGNEVTYNGTKAEFYGYTKEAIITKPSVTTGHVLWSLRNSANTQVATISQIGDVPYLTGFTSRKLKIQGYPANDTEGLSFTPSSATATNAIIFNNSAGVGKGSVYQTADGSVRHFCQTIDLTGYTNSQGPGINMVPGNTTGNYAMSIKNNAGTYIGGIWQDGDVVTFETTKIKLKTDASSVDSFATTLNTSTTAIPRCSAVSTALASYAPLAGATFTSQVNVPTLKLTGSPSAITAINTSMSGTPSNSSLLTELGVDTMVKTYCGYFVSDSGDTMTGQLALPSMKLNGTVVDSISSSLNTSTSSVPTCAAVSAAINSGTYLPIAGGTMTGNLTTPSLTMSNTLITAITTIDSSDHAALTTTEAAYDIADGWKTCPITGIIDCCTSYNGDVIFIHNGTKVYLSIDGGDSWSLGATLPSIRRIYCDNTAGVLLVVTYEDKAATMYHSLWYLTRNGSVLSTDLSGGYLFSSKALAATSFNPTSGILRLTAAGYMRSYTVSSAGVVTPISSADDSAPFNSIVMNDSSNTHLFTAPTGCFYATDNGQNLTSTSYIVPDGNLMVIGDSDLTHVYTYSTTGTKLYVSNNRLTGGTEIYNSPYGVINTACVANGRIYMITGSRLIVSYDCGATFEVVKTFVGAQPTYNIIKVVPKTGTIICSIKDTISWRKQSLYKNDLAPINLKAGYVFNRTVPTPILLPPPESWNFLEFNWTFMMSPPSVFTPVARVFVPKYSSMHIELRGIVKQHPTTVATSQYIIRRFYDFYRHDGAVTMTEINFADKSMPGTGGVAHPTCVVDGFYLNIGTYAYTMTTDVVVHTKIYKIQGFN